MDFASFRKFLESIGYRKINSSTQIINFKTKFIKSDDIVVVNWEMGGYIKSVSLIDDRSLKSNFDTPQEFIESVF
jgi:hypothetical protein